MMIRAEVDRSYIPVNREGVVYVAVYIFPPAFAQSNPINCIFVLDTSSSMCGEPLQGAKNAAKKVVELLNPNDMITLIEFNSNVRVVFSNISGSQKFSIMSEIDRMDCKGMTDIYSALDTARRYVVPNYVNRIILLTDGEPTEGITDEDEIAKLATTIGNEGASIFAAGFGEGYNEDLLEKIGVNSGGSWAHISDPNQMVTVFQNIYSDARTVIKTSPKLKFTASRGIKIDGVYQVKPEICKIDVYFDGNTAVVPIRDLKAGEEQVVVFKLRFPPLKEGTWMLASVELEGVKERVVVTSTSDPNLYSQRTSSFPIDWYMLAETTVILKTAINTGDLTKVKEVETKLRFLSSSATAIKDNAFTEQLTKINIAAEKTKVGLSEDEKKQIKRDVTRLK